MAIETTDSKELKAWLEDKPQEWSALIALRAALRSAPLIQSQWQAEVTVRRKQGLTLAVLRANLFSAVVGTGPTAENKNADAAAAAAAAAAADAAAAAAADAAAAAAADADAAAVWNSISQDLQILEDDGLEALQAAPIWHDGEPNWFSKSWTGLKQSLLADSPNWQVWIDFLQRRFLGKRSLFGLASDSEKEIIDAIVKEGEAFWDRDAHVVNADLEARIEEKRKRDLQRARLAALASPQPVITPEQQLDAHPNPDYDKPGDISEIVDLPARLLNLCNQAIDILGSGGNNRAGAAASGMIKSYRDEIASNGFQPSLGLLDDNIDLLKLEIAKPYAREEWYGEVEGQLNMLFDRHEEFKAAYPFDKEREEEYENYQVDGSFVLDPDFVKRAEEVAYLARKAHEAGMTTEAFAALVEKRVQDAKIASTIPEDQAKDSKLAKREALNNAGFMDKTVELAEKTDKIAKSESGKALIGAASAFGKFLWKWITTGGN